MRSGGAEGKREASHFGSSRFHSHSLFVDTGLGVWFVSCVAGRDCLLLLVCSVAIPATVFPLCLCGLATKVTRSVFWLVMGCDGFQTQKKKSWVSRQVRAERILADAITIYDRKEWTCKFCSESNVWTRWRCRRCYNNIPARLDGKYRQAVAAMSGEWPTGSSASSVEKDRRARSLEAENKELRARIDALKKEGRSARRTEYPF